METTNTAENLQTPSVIADMSMSLDGYIADADDGIGDLFGWFGNGDVPTPSANPQITWQTSEASAARLRNALANVGALIVGRHLYDISGGWGGNHPIPAPIFVVTHKAPEDWPRGDTSFTFVTDGIESAVAQAKARAAADGRSMVGVASAKIAQQCLAAGLLDQIQVSLVPVILGKGIPFFENLESAPVQLDDPQVIEGKGVTHLAYNVRRPS